MKHDELCELKYWLARGETGWIGCSCARRAFDKGEPIDPVIYPAFPIYDEVDDW
jgi:hypothetical protein